MSFPSEKFLLIDTIEFQPLQSRLFFFCLQMKWMRIKNFENLGIDHKQHPSKLVPGVNEGDTLPITFQEIPKKSIHKKNKGTQQTYTNQSGQIPFQFSQRANSFSSICQLLHQRSPKRRKTPSKKANYTAWTRGISEKTLWKGQARKCWYEKTF